MDSFLVGGAVRDAMLGLPVTDRDWVVVGSHPDAMRKRGFVPVGRDFPVFLHPDTHEEYALARTERKSAPGYHGFEFDSSEHVTLEADLARRDLTINAMARDVDGRLIDPYGGHRDLEARTLRHVSDAFIEDPVRVLRVARFMARLSPLGFRIAPATLELMRAITARGETEHLVAERVWQELEGALIAPRPRAFIDTLRAAGALAVVLPELDRLYGVPQPRQHHAEIDSALHVLMVLDRCGELDSRPETRFAALCHDLGKGTSPPAKWPAHHGHEERGATLTAALCERLRAPTRFRQLAVATARYHTHCHRVDDLRSDTILKLLEALDALRRPERLDAFLTVCTADSRGRGGTEHERYPQADRLAALASAVRAVDAADIAATRERGPEIARAIRAARLDALSHCRQRWVA